MTLIDKIKADREAGTAGPWDRDGDHIIECDELLDVCVVSSGRVHDARRIARVPDMEAALLAAEELAANLMNCLEVLTQEDMHVCCDGRQCGCYGMTKHGEAEHYANEALAAYRKAIGDE